MNVKNQFTIDKVLKLSLLCFVCIVALPLVKSLGFPSDQLKQKQAHLAVRAIGDVLLTNARDLSAPVPPVEEIDEQTLRLSFGQPIPINPDALAELAVKRIHSAIAPRAIVNVLDTESGKMVYGFEINHENPTEIPCLGRNLPKSTYYVEVSFYPVQPIKLGLNTFTFGLLGVMLVFLVLVSRPFFKERPAMATDENTIQVKGIKLDLNTNQIVTNDQKIRLTNKEAQVFSILFKNEGQLVSRDYLTQEVWLKEGVVTGRSLDMYISRLRKKVKGLSNTEILNQHGKGYTLKVQ
ncbi:MAG: winged helix-turn-helix transcriptional regulator [Phaeodactylibacter sp.]|nr:winged helix-turn-helix transcriptional regulator [Phaeodactylibacter sp.]